MTAFDAAKTPFIIRANAATPKFDSPVVKPASQPSTTEQANKAGDQHIVETRNVAQQQLAQQAQQTNTGATKPPNIFAAAFVNGNSFKNGLSDSLYKKNSPTNARNKASEGFGLGTDFGSMAAQLSADGGPSNAIKNMSARLDFFSNPQWPES